MGYKKANVILPRHLLLAIQEYIDGECVYIPRKAENKREWGENTQSRQRLEARNGEITARRQAGSPVAELAEQYFLSAKTIYKIIKAARNG